MAGDLQPGGGEVRKSHKLRVGRYSQHFVDVLQMDENPVQYLLRLYPESGLTAERMRAKLGKFGLSGHNHLSPIAKLSGGQKARVVFTSLSLQQPHILLLDEPTVSEEESMHKQMLARFCAVTRTPRFKPGRAALWLCLGGCT